MVILDRERCFGSQIGISVLLFHQSNRDKMVIFIGAILPLKKLLTHPKWKSEIKLIPDFYVHLETSLINL